MKSIQHLLLAVVFTLGASAPTTAETPDDDPASMPAEQHDTDAEQPPQEELMTRFGPMTESQLEEAANRGDTESARRHLEAFHTELDELKDEAQAVPRLGEGDVEQTTRRLARLTALDQFVRTAPMSFSDEGLTQDEEIFLDQQIGEEWMDIDRSNAAELKEYLADNPWPSISTHGEEADRDAWLLVQHADQDVEFQKQVLERLSPLVDDEETNPRNFAYLHDRVAVNSDQQQRYGTQGMCTGPGRWEPQPIEEPESVDQRRQQMGLGTMKEYKQQFEDICQ